MTAVPLNREAILRTADWLEANRDKHFTGSLAGTETGIPLDLGHPEATCFCALGRLATEMGFIPDDDETEVFESIAHAAGLESAGEIWRLNDRFPGTLRNNPEAWINEERRVRRGNPQVITLLRKLAA